MKIHEEVRRWRKDAGLTQAQVAKMTGLSQCTISNIERGMLEPRFDAVRDIAIACAGDPPGWGKLFDLPGQGRWCCDDCGATATGRVNRLPRGWAYLAIPEMGAGGEVIVCTDCRKARIKAVSKDLEENEVPRGFVPSAA